MNRLTAFLLSFIKILFSIVQTPNVNNFVQERMENRQGNEVDDPVLQGNEKGGHIVVGQVSMDACDIPINGDWDDVQVVVLEPKNVLFKSWVALRE